MHGLRYFIDKSRHITCLPFSVENLHAMAEDLGIKRCWFHSGAYPHYDAPRKMFDDLRERCEVITPRETLAIIQGRKVK